MTRGTLPGRVKRLEDKRADGRPRKEPPADAAERIEALAADGFSLVGIARGLGCDKAVLSRWFSEQPGLREAFDVGRAEEERVLRNVLFRIATSDTATDKDKTLAALSILNARHGWRTGEQEQAGNRLSINFTLPGAMRPEQFVVEQVNERSPEDFPVPRASAVRS